MEYLSSTVFAALHIFYDCDIILITDAKTEAEKSKKNRDWALGERDKIVQEREGIRSLCESLRHQRDRAVSDKAQALRDYDNIKKEKMEACKELKEVR